MNTSLCFKMARSQQRMFASDFAQARAYRKSGEHGRANMWAQLGNQSRGHYTFWVDQIARATGRDPKKVFEYFRLTREVSNA